MFYKQSVLGIQLLLTLCDPSIKAETPPPNYCHNAFNFELHYCALMTFPPKKSF